MNDITALMATMKAAAEKAIEANDRLCVMPPDEIFDVSLDHSKQLDADITLLNAHYDESTPANVLALVEALEARDKQIADSENRVRQQNRHVCELFDENAALRQRIASLESRTVTVKLPEVEKWRKPDAVRAQNAYRILTANELTAAGIQVIEGEGQ